MKIMYVLTGLKVAGAECVTTQLATRMLERGHQVCMVSLTGENMFVLPDGIELHNLFMSKTPWGMAKALWQARKLVKQFCPDVVHANMVHAVLFSRLLRLLVKMPLLISSEHNKNIEGKLRMVGYKWTDCLSDINTNVSEEALNFFIHCGSFSAGKSLTMYNGIDYKRFSPSSDSRAALREEFGFAAEDFVFINVARLMPAKDHFNLLQAFAKVSADHPQARLLLVGEGELRAEIEDEIVKLGLVGKVVLAGLRNDVERCYNAADCFVLSSAWEGFGLVIAEAMGCALPAVATDCGGTAEVLQQPQWLCAPKDSDALGGLMNKLIGLSAEERHSLGENNRKLALKFSMDDIVLKWEQLYKGVI